MQPLFNALETTPIRCPVCGLDEVRSDEVVDREVVFLHECPRCEHRWTSYTPLAAPTPRPPALRARARVVREARGVA